MNSILIILKKNCPRASSAPILGLFSITFVYTLYSRSQVSVYRTIGPLVFYYYKKYHSDILYALFHFGCHVGVV